MKILIIGFIAFFGWSTIATYIYVCKIQGLCEDQVATQIDMVRPLNNIVKDTVSKPSVPEQEVIPSNLIIYFAFDKYEFNANADADKYFEASKVYLDQNSKAWLHITGYTDAIGTEEYNQALGYRRAQSLQYYFKSKGILSNKIIIESKGEKEPADDNNTIKGRANNRITAITIKN